MKSKDLREKNILKKTNRIEELTLLDFKTYYEAVATNMVEWRVQK